MSIVIDNSYAVYQVTDTLHQLVDRLNYNKDVVDGNTRMIDSALSTLMLEYQPAQINADSDFSINTSELIINADSDIQIYSASDVLIRAPKNFEVDADIIKLDATSGIAFLDNGTEYASINHDSGNFHLQISVGSTEALTLSGTDASFPGSITMPPSGPASPNTSDKTVAGAITEVHNELDAVIQDYGPRINTLEGSVSSLQSNVSSVQTTLSQHDGRITNLEALQLSSRLNTIEADILNIKLRLDILEI